MKRAVLAMILLSGCATVERRPEQPVDTQEQLLKAGGFGAVCGMIVAFVIVGAASQNRTTGGVRGNQP